MHTITATVNDDERMMAEKYSVIFNNIVAEVYTSYLQNNILTLMPKCGKHDTCFALVVPLKTLRGSFLPTTDDQTTSNQLLSK